MKEKINNTTILQVALIAGIVILDGDGSSLLFLLHYERNNQNKILNKEI